MQAGQVVRCIAIMDHPIEETAGKGCQIVLPGAYVGREAFPFRFLSVGLCVLYLYLLFLSGWLFSARERFVRVCVRVCARVCVRVCVCTYPPRARS